MMGVASSRTRYSGPTLTWVTPWAEMLALASCAPQRAPQPVFRP